MSRRRVAAIVRKELRDYRRNRYMLVTMAIIPAVFLLQPIIYVLTLPAAYAGGRVPTLRHAPTVSASRGERLDDQS